MDSMTKHDWLVLIVVGCREIYEEECQKKDYERRSERRKIKTMSTLWGELQVLCMAKYYSITLTNCTKYESYHRKKERESIYIAPFIYYVYLKALRHGSHSFTCKYTMPAFPL